MEPLRESRSDVASIGKSVLIKGELSGSEDLFVDGEVEGNIDLHDHSLTIGPNGRVRANVRAKDVVVHGKVDGNVQGTDRVELKRSAVLVGDISTQRIVIEDGAYFKGAIDIKKDGAKPASGGFKAETTKPMASAAAPDYSSSVSSQSSLIEEKKY
jgi:cytoskeletal protein CcmA (bactofilin family)